MSSIDPEKPLAPVHESRWRDNSRLLTFGNALLVMARISLEPVAEIAKSIARRGRDSSAEHTRNAMVE
jgi:hypothetical protein